MKIERTQNATKIIKVGFLLKIYQIIAPFIMRTVMIYYMGVEYLGLNSLFSSVLQVLNIAELGVGSTMVFSMYKPIAQDDAPTICALMRLYRHYYRIIGLVIGVVGLALTPFIPKLVSGDIPAELNIFAMYLLNLGSTVLSYWLFAYKNCILHAHQRSDVSYVITVITNTIQYAIQLWIIFALKNYYLYIITMLGMQVVNNIMTAVIATKRYPQYKAYGHLEKQEVSKINRRILDLFTGKIGAVVQNSVDTIVISAFLGLKILAIYQNYYFILTAILGVVEVLLSSMVAGLGNSFITETREKNYRDMKKFTFMFMWLIGVCACCFLGMYQPFIELWVGAEFLLDFSIVICFVIYFYFYTMNRLLNVYKDAAGLWHEDRFRPLTTSACNLVLSLLWVKPYGLRGVLLATVFSWVVIGIPWILGNVFSRVFSRKNVFNYLSQIIGYVIAACVAAICVVLLCSQIHTVNWGTFILRGCICAIVPNALFFGMFRKNEQFYPSLLFVERITKGKLKLSNKLDC